MRDDVLTRRRVLLATAAAAREQAGGDDGSERDASAQNVTEASLAPTHVTPLPDGRQDIV